MLNHKEGQILVAILFFILSLAIVSIVFYSMSYGISPMPSSSKAKKALLQAIPTEIQGKIFELGSGWGTLAFAIAKRCPQCLVYAYEISIVPWLISRLIQSQLQLNNLFILRRDFFKVSLVEANLIVCYLYPGAMSKLKQKFEAELKPGTMVISHTFAVPGWTPLKIYQLNDLYKTLIYIYLLDSCYTS